MCSADPRRPNSASSPGQAALHPHSSPAGPPAGADKINTPSLQPAASSSYGWALRHDQFYESNPWGAGLAKALSSPGLTLSGSGPGAPPHPQHPNFCMDTLAWSSEHLVTVQSQAPGPRQATKEAGWQAGRHLMIMHQAKRPPGPECPALPMSGSFLATVSSMTSGASHILCVSGLGLLRTPVLTYGPVFLCQALCVGPWLTITTLGSLTASDPICGELGWRLPREGERPQGPRDPAHLLHQRQVDGTLEGRHHPGAQNSWGCTLDAGVHDPAGSMRSIRIPAAGQASGLRRTVGEGRAGSSPGLLSSPWGLSPQLL